MILIQAATDFYFNDDVEYKPNYNKKKQLRILIWNANGLLQQKHELEDLLSTYGIDLALICETYLKAEIRLSITGYSIYRTDREHGRGGGTAILVKDLLPHYRPDIYDTENLEATAAAINTKPGYINFFAAYNPHKRFYLKPTDKVDSLKSVIQPIILYGCIGWGYAAKSHVNKLQTTQNKILKLITGVDIRTRTDHTLTHRNI
uniref:Endonuclease/exonuclease/phosphatase domain-containing protein n=1 Tax=Timema poppense TaxID=170557 RepID=A0A7R9DTL1_TIMPO|nr:unnamed protein product [Timema poppensis]